jgi:hypothetical protein
MNDPQFIEAARNLAQKALATSDPLAYITDRVLCRPLKAKEQPILSASLADLRKHYTTSTTDTEALLKVGESKPNEKLPQAELAAWTMLCNQLMNLDEVLNK